MVILGRSFHAFLGGSVEVEGGRRFKDAKLSLGGAREWVWSETGTDHDPGILPADVEELLAHNAEVVVLSTGINERLCVCSKTLEMLKRRGIDFHVVQTEQAVQLYNKLRESAAVAGLFHSTC